MAEVVAQALINVYTTQNNDQRAEAERIIEEYKQTEYLDFLVALIEVPLQSPNPTLNSACIIMLFGESKRSSIRSSFFYSPDNQRVFLEQLSPRIVPLFQVSYIEPNHKRLLSIAIARAANYSFHTFDDSSFQEFLFSLFQGNDHLAVYLIQIFSEMINITPSLCGIDVERYFTIIQHYVQNRELFIECCNLFFSVVRCCNQEEETPHQLFQQLLSNVLQVPDKISSFNEILARFSRSNALFFAPVVEIIIPFICEGLNIGNRQICISSLNFIHCLKIGSKEMLQGLTQYHEIIILKFIQIIGSVTEGYSDDEDQNKLNDDSLSSIARETFSNIFECIFPTYLDIFERHISTIQGLEWQLIYAHCAIFSDTNFYSLANNKSQLIQEFIIHIINLINEEATPLHLKVTILDTLNQFYKSNIYKAQFSTFPIIYPIFLMSLEHFNDFPNWFLIRIMKAFKNFLRIKLSHYSKYILLNQEQLSLIPLQRLSELQRLGIDFSRSFYSSFSETLRNIFTFVSAIFEKNVQQKEWIKELNTH